MAQVYNTVRSIITTDLFEYDMQKLARDIQEAYDREGLDCVVQSCWKVKGEGMDVVVVDSLAPASSPVSEAIIMAIIRLIMTIVIAIVAIRALAVVERWFDFREQRTKTVTHDIIEGLTHPSVEGMIKWKIENYPEEFEKHPYYCPYCGAEFSSEEERNKHMEVCPEKPPPPPELPKLPTFGFGLISSIIQLLYYKAIMFRIPWLRR